MNSTATSRFHKLCLTTLVAVYFLVMVGGVVRSTGSGMGCPDWPTCFGNWVPPTSVDQLPDDYKEQYASYRDKKNKKFARYLSLAGFRETADKILNDTSILKEADFNPARTWVEYINRVVGVIIGLLIIALFYASWKIRVAERPLFTGSAWALGLVIVQGWFGSIVVSTNLTAWTVTVHMFLALVIVALLVWLLVRSAPPRVLDHPRLKTLSALILLALLIQIFLGTQVREALDLAAAWLPREQWMTGAGVDFVVHRSFSWTLLVLQIGWWNTVRKTSSEKSLTLVPFLLILLSLLTGTGMAYFGVPPWLQPIHLLLAVVTFGWFFQVYLYLRKGTATVEEK